MLDLERTENLADESQKLIDASTALELAGFRFLQERGWASVESDLVRGLQQRRLRSIAQKYFVLEECW